MKNNKYKNKYDRIQKVIWAGASTGVVTGLILMGSTNTVLAETFDNSLPVYTDSVKIPPMHMMRRWNSPNRALSLATNLGLNSDEVSSELKAGKNIKQILQENGIIPDQIHKAFSSKKSHNKRMWKQGLNKNTNTL